MLARLDEYLAAVRGGASRRRAGTCTGRATPPRRTRSSSTSRAAHGVDEVVKVKSLTTDEIAPERRARRRGNPRARDRLRRADPPARRRLVVAHPRARDPPQPHRDPRPVRADDRARHRVRRAGATSPRRRALYLRERFLDARVGVSGANFGVAETGHDLRRRVGGQRAHVHDAAAGARQRARDREARCRASPTSRSSCSCCRARRPASG